MGTRFEYAGYDGETVTAIMLQLAEEYTFANSRARTSTIVEDVLGEDEWDLKCRRLLWSELMTSRLAANHKIPAH